jgi:hypothetical protein
VILFLNTAVYTPSATTFTALFLLAIMFRNQQFDCLTFWTAEVISLYLAIGQAFPGTGLFGIFP